MGRGLNAEGIIGVYYVMDYGSAKGDGVSPDDAALKAADKAAQAAGSGAMVLVANQHRISANLTITSPIKFLAGGQLLPDTGVTITYKGAIDAKWYQIFGGAGTHAGIHGDAWAEWWGAKGDGTTDDSAAINAAIAAVAPNHGQVRLLGRPYAAASELVSSGQSAFALKGQGATSYQNGGTVINWTGTAGGTVLLVNWNYDVELAGFMINPVSNIGIGIDIDASGVTPGPPICSHVTLDRVRVQPDSSVSGHTVGTGLRIGHSGQGNCDRMRTRDCYFGGLSGNLATTGIEIDNVNSKILAFEHTQLGYNATGLLQSNGGFVPDGLEFESNTLDIHLTQANDPVDLYAPNTEGSTKFLTVDFTSAPILVTIHGGRLNCNNGGSDWIDMASRGTLICIGTDIEGAAGTTIYMHNGGAPGTVAIFDGCILPSATPFDLSNYADITTRGCFYKDGSGHGVRVPDGRVVAGANMAPTAAAGANAGTTPPAPVVAAGSNDKHGSITSGTGTTPTAGDQVDVTFSAPYMTWQHPQVAITPTNAALAALQPYVTLRTSGGAVIGFSVNTGQAPAGGQANTAYGFNYTVSG